MSGDLIDTTEMYLKTVFELQEEGIPPMRARIAERLDHSGPTVSQTVARMERDGLLLLNDQRQLEFTPEGERIATEVMRKHRLAERLLIDTIGLDFALAHTEACRWEHVISREVEEKIAALIARPLVDPYGNAIPGLQDLGINEDSRPFPNPEGYERIRLSELLPEVKKSKEGLPVLLLQIGEPLQIDIDLLDEFAEAGLMPGAKMQVNSQNEVVKLVGANDLVIHLNAEDAVHLVVGVSK